jgi:hypothetical protein
MKIHRYWAREQAVDARGRTVSRYGWSDDGPEPAREHARQRARAALAQLDAPHPPPAHYLYGDRPLREPIVETLGAPEAPTAIVTRNAYGALILNAADVFFADIDRAPPSPGAALRALIGRLWGRSARDAAIPERVEQAAAERPGLGLRLYRTAAGYRCLAASQRFAPGSPAADALLDALDSDPQYRRLCRVQQCFRARLSPKPWRCGLAPPPVRFPWQNEQEAEAFAQWQAAYDQACRGYAVCELAATFGPAADDPDLAALIRLHDRLTCVAGAPLA